MSHTSNFLSWEKSAKSCFGQNVSLFNWMTVKNIAKGSGIDKQSQSSSSTAEATASKSWPNFKSIEHCWQIHVATLTNLLQSSTWFAKHLWSECTSEWLTWQGKTMIRPGSDKDTQNSLRSLLSKDQTRWHYSFINFSTMFAYYEQEVRESSQWKVCSGPMRSFLSWLHGRDQFPFYASEFRVLLAIWFGFLIA